MSKPMWTVTNIIDDTMFSPQHGAKSAKRIDFQLYDGTNAHITIPDDEFNPDHIAEQVHNLASRMVTVLNMQGPDMGQPMDDTDYSAPTDYQGI